jgi:hypothetical protein
VTERVMAPDERALREHVLCAAFQAGVAAGRWRLVSLEWPFGVFAVTAADRDKSPGEFCARLDLTGYPNVGPTGSLWDQDQQAYLPMQGRPKGERVAMVFRCDNWPDAGSAGRAMYAPWDRVALQSHAQWALSHPRASWHAGRTLTFVLDNIHELLNAGDYLGV